MNVAVAAKRAAAVAFSISMMYAATVVRPETVLLETGRDPIRLEPDEGVITLPSLRPGTHLLKGTPIPQIGWRVVRVGDIGPERNGPKANSVGAGAAATAAPWIPLPRATLPLVGRDLEGILPEETLCDFSLEHGIRGRRTATRRPVSSRRRQPPPQLSVGPG